MARMRKHVVFVIDGSKSMDRMDAFDKESGDRIRRVDAVLDCIFEFIQVCRCMSCSTKQMYQP